MIFQFLEIWVCSVHATCTQLLRYFCKTQLKIMCTVCLLPSRPAANLAGRSPTGSARIPKSA